MGKRSLISFEGNMWGDYVLGHFHFDDSDFEGEVTPPNNGEEELALELKEARDGVVQHEQSRSRDSDQKGESQYHSRPTAAETKHPMVLFGVPGNSGHHSASTHFFNWPNREKSPGSRLPSFREKPHAYRGTNISARSNVDATGERSLVEMVNACQISSAGSKSPAAIKRKAIAGPDDGDDQWLRSSVANNRDSWLDKDADGQGRMKRVHTLDESINDCREFWRCSDIVCP